MVEEYVLLLHKVQLHVSALDNGHLQVVQEILSKQLYKAIWVVSSGEVGGEVGTTSHVCHRGWVVWVHGDATIVYYV
jgi:hypothetical protein